MAALPSCGERGGMLNKTVERGVSRVPDGAGSRRRKTDVFRYETRSLERLGLPVERIAQPLLELQRLFVTVSGQNPAVDVDPVECVHIPMGAKDSGGVYLMEHGR